MPHHHHILFIQTTDADQDHWLVPWRTHSRHTWTRLTVSPSVARATELIAQQISMQSKTLSLDAIICHGPIDITAVKNQTPHAIRQLPTILCFDTNPLHDLAAIDAQSTDQLDAHLTPFTAALTADRLWFKSPQDRTDFFQTLQQHFIRLNTPASQAILATLDQKACQLPPAINGAFTPDHAIALDQRLDQIIADPHLDPPSLS